MAVPSCDSCSAPSSYSNIHDSNVASSRGLNLSNGWRQLSLGCSRAVSCRSRVYQLQARALHAPLALACADVRKRSSPVATPGLSPSLVSFRWPSSGLGLYPASTKPSVLCCFAPNARRNPFLGVLHLLLHCDRLHADAQSSGPQQPALPYHRQSLRGLRRGHSLPLSSQSSLRAQLVSPPRLCSCSVQGSLRPVAADEPLVWKKATNGNR